VEEESIRLQEGKRGSSAKSEAQDKGISIIRLRWAVSFVIILFLLCMCKHWSIPSSLFIWYHCSADLQNAIDSEDYGLAAKLRDEISKLEAESLAVSAKALAFEKAEYAFRLGQKLRHKTFGTSFICIISVLVSLWFTFIMRNLRWFVSFRLPGCSVWYGSNLLWIKLLDGSCRGWKVTSWIQSAILSGSGAEANVH